MPQWLTILSWVSIILGLATAGVIAIDITRHRQHMAIMNIVWPVTGLYFPVAGWWLYTTMGRPMAVDAPKMEGRSPYWKSIFLSATHCGSGCVIGDIIGALIVLAMGWILLGQRLYSEYVVEFALAYLFGIAFQYFPIRAMRQIAPGHSVGTTPQAFIAGKRIGGYDDLRRFFGKTVPQRGATSYQPVIAVFAMTALVAMATSFAILGTPFTVQAAEWLIAFSMCVLAILKLQDVERFSTMFLNYDLLAQRWVPYGYAYPFAEALAGVLMVAGALRWLSVPVALFIGSIGAISVFKAVYIDKRELKCALAAQAMFPSASSPSPRT